MPLCLNRSPGKLLRGFPHSLNTSLNSSVAMLGPDSLYHRQNPLNLLIPVTLYGLVYVYVCVCVLFSNRCYSQGEKSRDRWRDRLLISHQNTGLFLRATAVQPFSLLNPIHGTKQTLTSRSLADLPTTQGAHSSRTTQTLGEIYGSSCRAK
jgi:hypothetical protein